MRRLPLSAIVSLAFATSTFAAPVSIKEIDLLVRMRTPEQEILRDVEQRRLLAPLDEASEKLLLKNGASPTLIQRLKTGNYTLSSEEAATFRQKQTQQQATVAQSREADTAAFEARQEQLRRQEAGIVSDTMRKMFEGKLVRMENGTLRPYSADELRNVRYYALYYSAHWCGPCRKFTPRLVEFYKQFKAQHPDFEVIFISSDYNPAGMQEYMKSAGMPWPAVKYELIDKQLRSLAGKGIPWLGIYNDAGEVVTSNGRTKQWIDPNQILRAFEQVFTQTAAR